MPYLVIAFFCGLSAGAVGRIKGSSFFIWFVIGAVLPILGTIAALLWRWEGTEPRRQCETCGAVVPLYVQVCMRCGTDLEWPNDYPLSDARS
jgi:hypothetical protein